MNIPKKETLTIEFKSDLKCLPDRDLIENVVAMANTEGGDLYLGVENDAELTGIHSNHQDTIGIKALIMNRTIPAVSVETEKITENNKDILKISIKKSKTITATSEGKILKRRLKVDGSPENIPLYPFEITSHLTNFNQLDYSAQIHPDSTIEDLNPLERERLRKLIRLNNGENILLDLNDDELDKALGLVKEENGLLKPTITGLLLIGKQERLEKLIPTAKTSFQILNGTQVKFNEEVNTPLLETFEYCLNLFKAQNMENEIQIGLSRIPIPDFSENAFREGLINAFSHRDYTVLNSIRIALDSQGLTITSPGSFLSEINLHNLLTIEPQSRNILLADTLKRIGLAEKTGRGIDRIFEGSLQFGKLLPDYSESTNRYVKLYIPRSNPDINFTEMIAQERSNLSNGFSVFELMILFLLKGTDELSFKSIQNEIGIGNIRLEQVLNRLLELNLIFQIGKKPYDRYRINSNKYKSRNNNKDNNFDEKTILDFIRNNNKQITRKELSEYFQISKDRAYRILKKLTKEEKLIMSKQGRSTIYFIK